MTSDNNNAREPSALASWTGHHCGVRVADFDSAREWYTETLDFRLIKTIKNGDATFGFLAPAGNDDFAIELVASGDGVARPPYSDLAGSHSLLGWHHTCFRCDDITASVNTLKTRGVRIVTEPFEVPALGVRIAFFADPWRNLFELLQPVEA